MSGVVWFVISALMFFTVIVLLTRRPPRDDSRGLFARYLKAQVVVLYLGGVLGPLLVYNHNFAPPAAHQAP